MPQFVNPFNNNIDRKLTEDEIIRTIRFSIAAELEAIQVYEQIVTNIDNKLVKTVLSDIANEEKIHAGELLKVLNILNPKELELYEQGKSEVEEKFM